MQSFRVAQDRFHELDWIVSSRKSSSSSSVDKRNVRFFWWFKSKANEIK